MVRLVIATAAAVVFQRAVGSGGSSVITIPAAQIEQESGAGTAERTSGAVASGRSAVVVAASAADIAARVVGARVVLAVESGRDENPATRFSFADRGFGCWVGPLFCWRRRCERRGSEPTQSNRFFV